MTDVEMLAEMKEIDRKAGDDPEVHHAMYGELIIRFFREYGLDNVADAYGDHGDVGWWYA